MTWMKQMQQKTRSVQATYPPKRSSTFLEYCKIVEELKTQVWINSPYVTLSFGWTANTLASSTNLFLEVGGLKSEQKLLDVIFPQLVNAARVDGPSKKLIHLILGVQGLLSAAATRQMEQ